MSYFSQIVCIDYIEKLNENENTENIIHAIPIDENNEISIVPAVLVERHTQYKYSFVSLSVILCCFSCFSIIIITISIATITNKNDKSLSKNSISNFTSYTYK